jgi:hypothetical protein
MKVSAKIVARSLSNEPGGGRKFSQTFKQNYWKKELYVVMGLGVFHYNPQTKCEGL